MSRIIPPLCLFLALASFIAAFTLVSIDRPEPSVDLHRARIGNDEEYRELLEQKLVRDQRWRVFLTGTLFTSGVALTVAAFMTMRPARPSS